jgi:hypothetical protein
LGPSGRIASPAVVSLGTFVAGTDDGRVLLQRVETLATFHDGVRRSEATLPAAEVLTIDPLGRPIVRLTARVDPSGGGATIAALTSDGTLVVLRESASTNTMTGEVTHEASRTSIPAPEGTQLLLLDSDA